MAIDTQRLIQKITSVNPATGEILRELQSCTDKDVLARVERAKAAQPAWGDLGIQNRIAILREFQKKLLRKKSEIAAAITREAGKPVAEALVTEALVVLDAARF